MGRFLVLLAVAGLLAGCGQKGPLYLPDKGGQVVTRPGGGAAQQPAPNQPSNSADDEQKKKDQQQQNPR